MKCPLCNDLNLEISALVSHLSAFTLQIMDFGSAYGSYLMKMTQKVVP